MTYAAQVQITADTALNTAHICYRKARRDCYRIHGLLTHPRTMEAAKIAIWSLYVGAVVAYTLGQSARILLQSWIDAQQRPAAMVEATTESPAAMTGAEVVQAEIEAAFLEEMIAAIEETEQPAAPIKAMTETQRLRKECTAKGIRWRNVRGKGKHMTLPAMKAALKAQASALAS